jgi:hypothetical protein
MELGHGKRLFILQSFNKDKDHILFKQLSGYFLAAAVPRFYSTHGVQQYQHGRGRINFLDLILADTFFNDRCNALTMRAALAFKV